MPLRNRLQLAVLALLLAISSQASGHELMDNRATFILRDQSHVSLTLYIDLMEAVRKTVAPNAKPAEFIVAYSAMSPEEFKAALVSAEKRMEEHISLADENGAPLTLRNWLWPEPAAAQATLRELAMRAIVSPGEHAHPPPAEIRAEAQSTHKIASLRALFPAELGELLVVSYQPKQTRVRPRTATEIHF